MSQEIHCPVCHRLLATEFEGKVQLKCHSCKTVVKVMTNAKGLVTADMYGSRSEISVK